MVFLVHLCALPRDIPALAQSSKPPLRIVATTTDAASLVREVGGGEVAVFCLSQGPEDPHTIEIRPSFVRELDRAELLVQVGLGIENAWLKDLLAGVRKPDVKPGGAANLNLGRGVRLLEGVEGTGIPGSFHEEGNPHYLLDPMEGLRCAKVIRDRLTALRPDRKAVFESRYSAFRDKLAVALAGEECAKDEDFEEVVLQFETAKTKGELDALLIQHKLGGWLAAALPHRGLPVVGDHDLWPYFARRYGLEIAGYLEPSPGVPPTAKHLDGLIALMKSKRVGVILSAPYFETRHGRFVARHTGARVLEMAHQTGGRKGTEDYFSMLQLNFSRLIDGLKGAK